MKFKIEIEMDGAAFEDQLEDETARILHGVAVSLESWRWRPKEEREKLLRDINGNRCGFARVED